MRKIFMPYADNKDADQPAHLRSLISTFVISCLDSKIPLHSKSEISILYLASVAAQAGWCPTWSQTPKTGFLVTRLKSYWSIWMNTNINYLICPNKRPRHLKKVKRGALIRNGHIPHGFSKSLAFFPEIRCVVTAKYAL